MKDFLMEIVSDVVVEVIMKDMDDGVEVLCYDVVYVFV